MPHCGATFDENSVPPWTRGDFRGVLERGSQPTPALRATPPTEGIFTRAVKDHVLQAGWFAGGYATNSCSGCFTVRTGQGDSRTTFSALEPKTRWLAPRRPCVANTIRSTLSFSASRTI